VDATPGGELSEQFKIMERRLARAIMWPAAIVSWLFGLLTAVTGGFMPGLPGWLWLKLVFVVILTGIHWMLHRYVEAFAADRRVHSARYFRLLNEVPTVILIGVVVTVILKPNL
jgi:putative membrane protein